MGNKFDPYYEWLGIPPKHQPANHYRLLGIAPYESDPKVIKHATNQRLAYLRTLQTGPRGKAANQLLNEISRAQHTLLDPKKRLAYEAEVESTTQSKGPAPTSKSAFHNHKIQKVLTTGNAALKKWITVADLIKLGILGIVILVALGFFLFKDPYLKIHVIDENGQPIQAEVPFTELTPAKADKKKLFIHSLSNGNPAEWLFDEMENDVNNIRIYNYDGWPNREYPYEIVGPREQTFDRSGLYLSTPSITFTLRNVEPIQIEGKLKGDFKGRNIAVCLDTSGNEIASDIGTEIDATPTNRFIYLKRTEKGKFELQAALLRTTDNPSIKVIERTGRTYKLIGTQSIDQYSNNVTDLTVKIEKSNRKRMSIRGKLRVLPKGNSPGGFIAYMDRNHNERPDSDEPQTQTTVNGSFFFVFEYFKGAGPQLLKIYPQKHEYRQAILESTPQMRIRNNFMEVIDADFAIQRR